ncbi:MAG: hypothetical protein Q9160_007472 [Pyrenula sp. 1 TL-2023]
MGLASLSIILAAALSLALASPMHPRDDPIYQSDHVRFQVRQSNGLPATGPFAGYYLSSAHVGAGSSIASLTPDFATAGEFYYNSTQSEAVPNKSYLSEVTAVTPYDMIIDTGAGKEVQVYFRVGVGDRIFYTNAANWLTVNVGPGVFVACKDTAPQALEGALYWSPTFTFTPTDFCEEVYLWQEII